MRERKRCRILVDIVFVNNSARDAKFNLMSLNVDGIQ
jgi:hypothetical protein